MLNKKGLAAASGVSQHTIVRWEKGGTTPKPSDENILAFSRVLGFPKAFFFRGDIEEPDPEFTSFRSFASMSAARRDAALAAGSLGFEISDWVEDRFTLPAVNVPDVSLFKSSVEAAARVLREEWGLGEKPISNMIHLLESKGVKVFSLTETTAKVNAFSHWLRDKPYVFLNTFKSAECSRFDAAHELGHLVLHHDGSSRGRSSEDQANAFASAFLMPKSDILAHIPYRPSLSQLIKLKRRWKVSLAALCYRLHKLELLTDWTYRSLCVSISKHKYNKNEPNSIDRERSVLWEKVLRKLWSEKMTHYDIARDLALPDSEVEGLLFGILPNNPNPDINHTNHPRLV